MRNFTTKADNTAPLPSGILTANEDNVRFQELENAVSSSGQELNETDLTDNDNNQQLAEAMARYASGGVWYQDTSQVANVLQLATGLAFVMPTALFKGLQARVIPAAVNTGAVQCNLNNLGLKKVFDPEWAELIGGELVAGYPIELEYDPAADSGAGAFILTPWSLILSRLKSIGTGVPVYKGVTNGRHEFYSLEGVNGTTIVINGSNIQIDGGAAPSASGEVNYGANVGTGEGLLYRDKVGAVLNFKKIKAGDGINVTNGTDDVTIEANVPSTPDLETVAPVWMINEERLGSVNASVLPANQWTKRNLNTTVGVNQIADASLSSGRITLPPGAYRVMFCTVVSKTGFFISRLFNVTAGVELTKGTGGDALPSPGYSITCQSMGLARFELSVTSVLELQTYCGGSVSPTAGYAGDSQNNVPPFNHVDGWIEIVKEA